MGIPPTVQAMIAARIDRLPAAERKVLRRAAVAGRTFWSGAIEAIGEDSDPVEMELHELVERDFLVREPRSTIRGEEAFRFKHVLIRDVAYAGLPKSSRALLHRQMATGSRRAASPTSSSRSVPTTSITQPSSRRSCGAQCRPTWPPKPPPRSSRPAAGARPRGGMPAARRLLVRAAELEDDAEAALPGRKRRLADDGHSDGLDGDAEVSDAPTRQRWPSRTGLDRARHLALYRDGDNDSARELAGRALDVSTNPTSVARFDAPEVLRNVAWWEGDLERWSGGRRRLAVAEPMGRSIWRRRA